MSTMGLALQFIASESFMKAESLGVGKKNYFIGSSQLSSDINALVILQRHSPSLEG